jgi:hypothetical protein
MDTNEFTNVASDLEKRLAQYGVTRGKAVKGAGVSRDGDYNYFGIKANGNDTPEMAFDVTPKQMQKRDMDMAIVPPEFDAFDMIAPVTFDGIKQISSIDRLKAILRKLFDEA